ncbi:MAG: hypothetical protein ACW98K_10190 [Candidatus Kariarchaeaceae archaeon]|jgi:hypothetical protein
MVLLLVNWVFNNSQVIQVPLISETVDLDNDEFKIPDMPSMRILQGTQIVDEIVPMGSNALLLLPTIDGSISTGSKLSKKEEKKNSRVHIVNGKFQESTNLHQILKEKIKGKTLEVYYYIYRKGTDVGVREIQREFGYSSPGLAAYHLNRLLEYDVVVKDESNRYNIANSNIKLGELQNQVKIRNYWISIEKAWILINSSFLLLGLAFIVMDVNKWLWIAAFFIAMISMQCYFFVNRK